MREFSRRLLMGVVVLGLAIPLTNVVYHRVPNVNAASLYTVGEKAGDHASNGDSLSKDMLNDFKALRNSQYRNGFDKSVTKNEDTEDSKAYNYASNLSSRSMMKGYLDGYGNGYGGTDVPKSNRYNVLYAKGYLHATNYGDGDGLIKSKVYQPANLATNYLYYVMNYGSVPYSKLTSRRNAKVYQLGKQIADYVYTHALTNQQADRYIKKVDKRSKLSSYYQKNVNYFAHYYYEGHYVDVNGYTRSSYAKVLYKQYPLHVRATYHDGWNGALRLNGVLFAKHNNRATRNVANTICYLVAHDHSKKSWKRLDKKLHHEYSITYRGNKHHDTVWVVLTSRRSKKVVLYEAVPEGAWF